MQKFVRYLLQPNSIAIVTASAAMDEGRAIINLLPGDALRLYLW